MLDVVEYDHEERAAGREGREEIPDVGHGYLAAPARDTLVVYRPANLGKNLGCDNLDHYPAFFRQGFYLPGKGIAYVFSEEDFLNPVGRLF
jgi:hypothetical protein